MTKFRCPKHIRFSPEAQHIIDETRRKAQALGQSPAYDQRLQAALQKSEGQLVRLALTFHMIENRGSDCVSAETAAKTTRLFMRYVVPSVVMFYHDIIGASAGMVSTRLAAGYILAHNKNTVTERDLYRAHREFRGDEGRSALAKTMSQLELAAWVSPIQKAAGRPISEWRVNPRVHTEFAELAQKERTRREGVMAAIQGAAKVSHLSLEASIEEEN